jgi:hypothetical protein
VFPKFFKPVEINGVAEADNDDPVAIPRREIVVTASSLPLPSIEE